MLDGFECGLDELRGKLWHYAVPVTSEPCAAELRGGLSFRIARIAAWHHATG